MKIQEKVPPINPSLGLLTMQYVEAIQQLASDPEIAATTRIAHPYPEGAAKLFIETSEKGRAEGTTINNVILNNNTFVGVCGLMSIQAGEKAELGYWLGKPFWGKGLASFAVDKTLELAFGQLGLKWVFAVIVDFNIASRRVLEKNGFTFKRADPQNDPKLKPEVKLHIFEITKAEWMAHKYGPLLSKSTPL